MKVSMRAGRLSDLAEASRRDWSEINQRIRALTPGEVLELKCPRGVSFKDFRSVVLTYGRRSHPKSNGWMIATRSNDPWLKVFLGPVK